eukprot:PhF_6_TR18525/c0_g1_i1/m.27062/K04078/groES, HSPE1; chaperonin GroES
MFRFSSRLNKTIQPLGKRVLVRRVEAAKETKSGILIPEQAQGRVNEGKVVAVAEATKDWEPKVQMGDTVLLPEFGGTSVKIDGVEMSFFNEDQLLGVSKN